MTILIGSRQPVRVPEFSVRQLLTDSGQERQTEYHRLVLPPRSGEKVLQKCVVSALRPPSCLTNIWRWVESPKLLLPIRQNVEIESDGIRFPKKFILNCFFCEKTHQKEFYNGHSETSQRNLNREMIQFLKQLNLQHVTASVNVWENKQHYQMCQKMRD